MKKAVIFDWAGTTVDYGCFAPVQAFQDVFAEFGVEPTLEETRKPMGMLKIDHIRTMLKMERIAGEWEKAHGRRPQDDDAQRMYPLFEGKLFAILDRFAEPKPGVLEAVAELREMGVKIGSTTGYTTAMMDIVAPQAVKMGYAPDSMVTPDETGNVGRPFPYMVFKNMENLGVASVDDVVKVGDTVSDIKEGKAAGVFTVGVIEGSSEAGLTQEEFDALDECAREELCACVEATFRENGADAVIRTMAELPALVRCL